MARLQNETLDAFVSALSEAATIESLPALRGFVANSLPGLSEDDASDLVSHLLSIATLRNSHDFSNEDLSAYVVATLDEDLEDPEEDRLLRVLDAVLTAPAIQGFAKAIDIGREQDRLLHIARIVTDVRPVFGEDPSSEPMGALVVHSLRLDYFADGRIQSQSFALDSQDLAELRKTLERAETKEKTLGRALENLKWHNYRLAGEDS